MNVSYGGWITRYKIHSNKNKGHCTYVLIGKWDTDRRLNLVILRVQYNLSSIHLNMFAEVVGSCPCPSGDIIERLVDDSDDGFTTDSYTHHGRHKVQQVLCIFLQSQFILFNPTTFGHNKTEQIKQGFNFVQYLRGFLSQ